MNANEKALNWIAERSPKKWAKEIRRRFQWALEQLIEIEDALNTNVKPPVFRRPLFTGCPHCNNFQCETVDNKCLYPEAQDKFKIECVHDYACADIQFNGQTLAEADDGLFVRVTLSSHNIEVYRCYGDLPQSSIESNEIAEEINKCKAFCQGHIDWTKNPKWGTKVRKRT